MKSIFTIVAGLLWVAFISHAQTKIDLVKDIGPGFSSGINLYDKTQAKVIGKTLYFVGNSSTAGNATGNELWKSDGTLAGTQLVKDIRPGGLSSAPQNFAVVGDKLFFIADDGVHGLELWVSDGTEAGTNLVKDISPGGASTFYNNSSFNTAIGFKGKLFFSASNDVTLAPELYVTDGTEAGTKPFRPEGSTKKFFTYPSLLLATDTMLFFTGEQASAVGIELFKTDGTITGTSLLKETNKGSGDCGIESIFNNGKNLYFFAVSTASDGSKLGVEPWISDGTTEGTNLIANISSSGNCTQSLQTYYKDFQFYDGKVYFSATDMTELQQALWSYDPGSTTLTKITKDSGKAGNQYNNFTIFDNRLYYFNGANVGEISSTDGITTSKIYDSNLITNWSTNNSMVTDGKALYAISDKTGSATGELIEISQNGLVTDLKSKVSGFQNAYRMFRVGDEILMFVKNSNLGTELYKLTNTTSTENLDFDVLTISPNPASERVNIEVQEPGVLQIFNIMGQKVQSEQFDNTGKQVLDIQQLPDGTYFMQVQGGTKVYTGKIVKQ